MKPEIRALLKQAKAHGAVLRPTGGHTFIRFPNGRTMTISSSPSDTHAVKNMQRDLKRIIGDET